LIGKAAPFGASTNNCGFRTSFSKVAGSLEVSSDESTRTNESA
jgi:hypothetical protein